MGTPIQFNYIDVGNPKGRPVFFLHGFLGDRRDWDEVVAALSADFRCIAVDLPGHGRTTVDGGLEQYELATTAGALVGLADRLGFGRLSVVGYSMGARLALLLARRFPERVDRIVLESGSPGLLSAVERGERLAQDEEWAKDLEAGPLAAFVQRWYEQELFASLRQHPERFVQLVQRRLEHRPHELAKSLRASGTGRQPNLWSELGLVACPVLLIVGALDAKYVYIGEEMLPHLATAELERIPGCGHNVHFENVDTYTGLVRNFLRRKIRDTTK
ncbi:MAG: 2-succinyl-6-hydroxy-2,4-cyclohexadiene-1-carboxylate synthase [Candidatus Hydrogenedentes bacterium]|nr:2-succinyl-6-hydroxy-2,4-cyclohexadiene-1-carboxylate synthase [Candidatus Hydrogenedentota bacterium]